MIEILRYKQSGNSTLSQLYFDGVFECWLLEDAVRNTKVHGETCIPEGEYNIGFNTDGGMNAQYKKYYPVDHKGMIEIKGIPNYGNVYLHRGNRIKDTLGCPLLGDSWGKEGKDFLVMQSIQAYERVYKILCKMIDKGDTAIKVRNLDSIIPLDYVQK